MSSDNGRTAFSQKEINIFRAAFEYWTIHNPDPLERETAGPVTIVPAEITQHLDCTDDEVIHILSNIPYAEKVDGHLGEWEVDFREMMDDEADP